MRGYLLATTFLSMSVAASAQSITPGAGSLSDAHGSSWTITASGSVMENGEYTPGGGGTSALTITDGVIYGRDNGGNTVSPGGWFSLNAGSWEVSQVPAGGTATRTAASASAVVSPVAGDQNAAPTCAAPSGGTGTFQVSGGVITGPDGQPFVARGINIMYSGGVPSVRQVQATFPGLNFVRLAIYDYASPSALASYVTSLTSKGIVVELEDHNNNAGNAGGSQGMIFTGQALSTELNWYSQIGAAFKNDPYVWFGTNNEPSEIDSSGNINAAALSKWQMQTVQAVRGAGNNSVIMIEMNCDPTNFCGAGYSASAYAAATKVVWDLHYYNWVSGYSTDQATNQDMIQALAASAQKITSANGVMPVIIGEYGNSTSGVGIDPGGQETVAAVINIGSTGAMIGGIRQRFGSAAWAWGSGNPGDGLTASDGTASVPYGQAVQLYINTDIVAPAACQANARAEQVLNTIQQTLTPDTTAGTPSGAVKSPAEVAPQTQQQVDAIQAQIPTIETAIAATQEKIRERLAAKAAQ